MPNPTRRDFLKTASAITSLMVTAKALPETWTRPVINSVLLPAHAQLSTITSPASYSIQCGVLNLTNSGGGNYIVSFTYTPVDSSGALDNQLVNTVYTVTDQNNTVLFGPNTLTNTRFAVVAGPAVGVMNPIGFVRVTITFQDQVTYGTGNCVMQENV